MRLGFLGPAGTFSEEAVRAGPLEDGAHLVPFPSIHDAGDGRQVLHDCERIGARPSPQPVKITV